MELLIAILMCLGLYATPERLTNTDFVSTNQHTIDLGNRIIENNWYHRDTDGGVVIDPGVGT